VIARLAGRVRNIRRDDAGVTLAEMMVVILILGLVMAVVQGTVIAAQKTTNATAGRIETGTGARIAIDSVTRNLRTAVLPQDVAGSCTTCPSVAFVQGTATSVQFYANNNTDQLRLGPMKVTYTLTNRVLTERMQKPDAHDPAVYSYTYCTPNATNCVVPTRVLTTDVDTTRVFTYYDRTGAALTGASLNAAQLSQVDSMDVVVPVVRRGQKTTLVQRVSLPNADSVPEVTTTP
jgi:prepilin-type N-terminal cleavage/methylation domain-containing protein